jgi:hypothetical protein
MNVGGHLTYDVIPTARGDKSSHRTARTARVTRDTAEWRWSVSATEPGDYELALVVTTFQGDTGAGVAGALAGIHALRAPLAELLRGRREARKQHGENRDEDRGGSV